MKITIIVCLTDHAEAKASSIAEAVMAAINEMKDNANTTRDRRKFCVIDSI